jgi:hypothetical protein
MALGNCSCIALGNRSLRRLEAPTFGIRVLFLFLLNSYQSSAIKRTRTYSWAMRNIIS